MAAANIQEALSWATRHEEAVKTLVLQTIMNGFQLETAPDMELGFGCKVAGLKIVLTATWRISTDDFIARGGTFLPMPLTELDPRSAVAIIASYLVQPILNQLEEHDDDPSWTRSFTFKHKLN